MSNHDPHGVQSYAEAAAEAQRVAQRGDSAAGASTPATPPPDPALIASLQLQQQRHQAAMAAAAQSGAPPPTVTTPSGVAHVGGVSLPPSTLWAHSPMHGRFVPVNEARPMPRAQEPPDLEARIAEIRRRNGLLSGGR